MNENEVVEVNANGSFITPQIASFAATLWNDKNPKNGVAYIALGETQLRKLESLYMGPEGPRRPDVEISKHAQTLAHIPIRVDKLVPDTEIHMRDSQDRLVAKIVTLEK
jgi:hypothetical protein